MKLQGEKFRLQSRLAWVPPTELVVAIRLVTCQVCSPAQWDLVWGSVACVIVLHSFVNRSELDGSNPNFMNLRWCYKNKLVGSYGGERLGTGML